MMEKVDKRERAHLFRERLAMAISDSGTNQSQLARQVGVDRSTVSQILKDDAARLPNAQVVGECASVLGVSTDWLLGLSERPERAADLLAASMTMTHAPRALVDEQIFTWHKEAAGYKIRHVPAAMPDMLKTQDLLRWEYEPSLGKTTDQAIGASEDRLSWMRSLQSDYEIAMPMHELQNFAHAQGYYASLPPSIRHQQIDWLLTLHEQLYPSLRIFLFDARKLYSAPITIFGPLLSVIYMGSNYLAFRDKERVQTITRHFDGLIREAEISSRHFPEFMQSLRDEI